MKQLTDKQRKRLLLLLNDSVWCGANPSSDRALTNTFYTEEDSRTFNQHIVPRYIEYLKH